MTLQGFAMTVIALSLLYLVLVMWTKGLKEIEREKVEEELLTAIKETGRPLVKVDVEMRGKW